VKRPIAPAWMLALLLAAPALLGADTLRDIDRAVAQLSAFVRDTVPDQEGLNVSVLPFTSDKLGRVVLGDRLKSELELSLAAAYSRTRVVNRPEGTTTYTVAGEIQRYPGTVRVVCRVTRPDGSLGGGTRADIPSSPELESLLEPVGPSGVGGQGLHDLPGAPGAGGFAGDDPLEPDDIPGFEVEVPEGGFQVYNRSITRGDIDRFRFYVPDATTVVLEVQTEIDLQLLLFREGENVPFEVAGSRGGEALRLPVSLAQGYYIVEVLAFDFNVLGPYTLALDLSGHSIDDFEPDDLREQARQIFPGNRQQRTLLPGDEDWAELSFTVPGFYAVYTEGLQVDTRIEIYEDSGRLITEDDNSGSAANAYAGLFLGVRRTYVKVSGKGALDTGSYTLAFERVEPAQVYPASQARHYPAQPRPLLLQLRILQPGRYLIEMSPADGSRLEVYALPAMRRLAARDSLFALSSGDYLVSASLGDGEAEGFALCVAAESEAEQCRRSVQRDGHGRPDR